MKMGNASTEIVANRLNHSAPSSANKNLTLSVPGKCWPSEWHGFKNAMCVIRYLPFDWSMWTETRMIWLDKWKAEVLHAIYTRYLNLTPRCIAP